MSEKNWVKDISLNFLVAEAAFLALHYATKENPAPSLVEAAAIVAPISAINAVLNQGLQPFFKKDPLIPTVIAAVAGTLLATTPEKAIEQYFQEQRDMKNFHLEQKAATPDTTLSMFYDVNKGDVAPVTFVSNNAPTASLGV